MSTNLKKETAETILSNPLVAQRIMKGLDTKTLFKASLVNKTWNREARTVLRDSKKCILAVSGDSPCSTATELNNLLESSSNPIPFNGIYITIDRHQCDAGLCQQRIDQVYGNLLAVPFKYLKFQWSTCGKVEKCALGQFILRLMSGSLSLEELNIEEIPMKVKLEPENKPQEGPHELPKLKILKLPENELEELLKANLVKVLSDRSPHLEQLENEFYPECVDLLPPNKLHIVKNLCIHEYEDQAYGREIITNTEEFLNNIRRISESAAKLRTLSAVKPYFIDRNTGDMKTYLAHLLGIILRSSESLTGVKLDHFAAVMLKRLRIDNLTIPNVTTVHFVMFQGKNAGLGRSLEGARLAVIFPNVTSIRFSPGSYKFTGENGLVAEANDDKFPWLAVKKVDLGGLDLNEQTVTEVGALFPNLRELAVQVSYETPDNVPFQQMWSSCPSLRSLTIGGELNISGDANLDAVFCGIHPEEAEILQEKDEEFLTAVNIVPAFPSINHLKDLKSLKLELKLTIHAVPPTEESKLLRGEMFVSKVTGLTALRRMPDLVFEVVAPFEAAEYLDHLKAFARLDFHPPNPTAAMSYEDAFAFLTGTNLVDTLGDDYFANLDLQLEQLADEDDEDGEQFDFSGRF